MSLPRHPHRQRRAAWAALIVAALLGGCAGPATSPALEEANAAVERARSSPRVRALAAAELDLAEVALEQAGAAARAGAPRAEIEHLAYVASQRAALAEARAAAEVARAEAKLLRRSLTRATFERLRGGGPERSPPREAQKARPPPAEDRQEHASVDDGAPRAPEPVAAAEAADTGPRQATLRLGELAFEQGEPSEEARAELAALAERLAREPGLSLLIEADFDRPEPGARTAMEQRVEAVRAFLLARGVAPERLVVRPGEDGPAPPPASAFVASPG
ncbi:MAG TPA: DUF4398 domain-containing protein [Geminicoccaceae bacterium]|nr:DUF4398 domain-containing protein [Geminicoccaceae bacterium]